MRFLGTFEADKWGDFVSQSEPGAPSPAYLVASAARREIREGRHVRLPVGYSLDVLENVCWILGSSDVEHTVSANYAVELAEIARELLRSEGGGKLAYRDKQAAQKLIREVEKQWPRT